MDDNAQIREVVHKIGAYSINTETPYIYTSGILMPDYVDMRLLCSSERDGGYRTLIIKKLADRMRKHGDFDFIAAVITADVPYASMLAHETGMDMFYVRDKPKGHGQKRLIEGVQEGRLEGKRIVHVGDLMTTGKTGKIAHKAITDEGGKLPLHIPIFNRLQGGDEALGELDPPVEVDSLCLMDMEFYDHGIRHGHYSNESFQEVVRAKRDAIEWGEEFLKNNPEFIKQQILRAYEIGELEETGTCKIIDSINGKYPKAKLNYSHYIYEILNQLV